VDDDFDSLRGAAKALRIRHVALDELRSPGCEHRRRAVARTAHESPHREVSLAQSVHDPRAHESVAAGDQDHALDSTILLL
jgi:hypothetical protein